MAGGTKLEHVRQLVMDKLANSTAIQALVGTRVSDTFPDRTQGADAAQYPCIATYWRGGSLHWIPVLQKPEFEVSCYSRISRGEAVHIYEAVVTALQNERLVIVGVPSVAICQEIMRPADVYDGAARIWEVRGLWIARAVGDAA